MKYKHGLAFPDADEYLFERLPEGGVWQDDALQAGLKHCKNFRTAIDGGAHIGTWSLELSQRFAQVIAFEPSIDTYEALQTNVRKYNHIETHQKALGAFHGYVRIEWDKKDKARKHTGARYVQPGGAILQIELDEMNLSNVDFMKLDLEGAETNALIGAEATLRRCKPVIVFEDKGFNARRFHHSQEATREFLRTLGAVEFEKCGINRVWGWR